MKRIISLLLVIFSVGNTLAQDTQLTFSVIDRGDKVTVTWVNPFPNAVQLNVQRSFDSLRNFTTVFSAPSPQLPQNGYTEAKMPTNRIFYRIFYVLEGGSYFFTEAKRVGTPSTGAVSTQSRDIKNPNLFSNIDPNDNRIVTIKLKETIYKQIPAYSFRNFRDSILRQTKDTMIAINDSLVVIHPFIAKEVWRPSVYVYTNKDGYVHISVPFIRQRKYSIKFYEDNGPMLFEIRQLRESPVVLDKANFIHAGWFVFELYEDDKLKEKNKFYLPKDF